MVARHERSFEAGALVLGPRHVLALLERKSRAVGEATALQRWKLPRVFHQLREALKRHTRRPDREWVPVLRLLNATLASESAALTGVATRANEASSAMARRWSRSIIRSSRESPRKPNPCALLIKRSWSEPIPS